VAPPLGVRAWLTVWKHATPEHVLSYQIWSLFGTPFGHMQGDSKISERWAPPLGCRGVADPSETRFSTTCVIMPNLVIPDPPEKKLPLASRLPRSLKVIGTDTDRSDTYDFLLLIQS